MHLDDPYERGTQDPSSDNFTPTTSVIGSIHFLVFSLPSIEETSIQGQPSILVLFVLAPSSFSSVLLLTGCSSALTTRRKVVDASKHSSRTRKAAADDENIENEGIPRVSAMGGWGGFTAVFFFTPCKIIGISIYLISEPYLSSFWKPNLRIP